MSETDTPTVEGESEYEESTAARIELLAEENHRLRAEYARAKQSKYRRTAYGLFTVGLVTVAVGLLVTDGREVLLTLGVTGLFGGVLTFYLTPSRFVAADVSERIYAAMANNYEGLVSQLGLSDIRLYIPATELPARLYVPQSREYQIPDPDDGPLVVEQGERGLLVQATGALLYWEFEQTTSVPVATGPEQLATQLMDALSQQFELVDAVDADAETAAGRLTFRLSGGTFGNLDRFDHPIPSFVAASYATALDTPVRLEVDPTTDRADWLVTLRWEPSAVDTELRATQ